MKKIVYLPLDERPCNALFPVRLFGDAFDIAAPSVVGFKKRAVAWEDLRSFLDQETPGADGLVLSMDMLLYGGLIPSRLHHLDRDTVLERLNYLRDLRRRNPSTVIYAFQCIMRCPKYSSSDEEPDYYGECGREIFQLGEARHRRQLGLEDGANEERLSALVPKDALEDYLSRRAFNLSFNLEALELVREGVIDELVFPQDDAARYGFTAQDQARVRARISELRLNTRVLLYPGADELGLTIMSRMLLHFENRHPLVYVKMASVNAASVIPPFEDRPLGETIKYHLISAGCRLASSVSEADMVLGVSFPGCAGQDILAAAENAHDCAVERTLIEFLLFLEDALKFRQAMPDMKFIYVGGLVCGDKINEVLSHGFEAVQMARSLLNEPDFVNRLRQDPHHRCGCRHSNYCIGRMYTADMACHQHLDEPLPDSLQREIERIEQEQNVNP